MSSVISLQIMTRVKCSLYVGCGPIMVPWLSGRARGWPSRWRGSPTIQHSGGRTAGADFRIYPFRVLAYLWSTTIARICLPPFRRVQRQAGLYPKDHVRYSTDTGDFGASLHLLRTLVPRVRTHTRPTCCLASAVPKTKIWQGGEEPIKVG